MTEKTNRRHLILLAAGSLIDSSIKARSNRSNFFSAKRIGVNCFDLFYGPLLKDSNVRTPITRIRELKMAGIPFIRFAASPFWPIDWKLYMTDRSKYFSVLDSIIEAADAIGIGLIPSVFWNPSSVSDLVGEPLNSWGISSSKTHSFMAEYIYEMMTRYKASRSIWMWEFGNEFNAYSDLDNSLNWFPKVNVAKGTPPIRGINDKISSIICRAAYKSFATEVRNLDNSTLITTGSDIPRDNAFNLSRGKYGSDTASEYRSALLEITPSPADVVSIHMYQKSLRNFSSEKTRTYSSILSETVKAARSASKFCFVGEFGIPKMLEKEQERKEFKLMLEAIVQSDINWAAVWVYDLFQQRSEWSIQNHGDRAYQLEMIAAANLTSLSTRHEN